MPPEARVRLVKAQHVFGGLDGVGDPGSMESSSVQPNSLSAFAFPLLSRKFPLISIQHFLSIDFFFKVHSTLTLGD